VVKARYISLLESYRIKNMDKVLLNTISKENLILDRGFGREKKHPSSIILFV